MSNTRCAVMCALIVVLAGCSKSSKDDPSGTSAQSRAPGKPDSAKPDVVKPDVTGQSKQADNGDFRPVYGVTENKELGDALREARLLEVLSDELNEVLALPRNVPIELRDCDEPNAYYDSETHKITVCYNLIETFAAGFERMYSSEDDLLEATLGATLFTFYHELGHALVHELDLPITGKEEDSVDQLATVILLAGGEEGELMALDGAESFILESKIHDFDELPFWGEHSLDEQRFYSIICLVYGSDPDKFSRLVESGELPEERAERCPDEFVQIERAWLRLLEPHMKS